MPRRERKHKVKLGDSWVNTDVGCIEAPKFRLQFARWEVMGERAFIVYELVEEK